MKRFALVSAFLTFVATGCASLPHTAQGPCLPPGIAVDVFQWAVVETGTLGTLPVEGGGSLRLVYVLYERGERRVAIGWVAGRILFVDPEPSTPAPPWYNEALISEGHAMRTAPTPGCQWRRQTGTQA